MTYKVNYEGDQASQAGVAEGNQAAPQSAYSQTLPPTGKRFVIPSIIKTGATLAVAGGLFFGAEIVLPGDFKPSTLVGTYDARVSSAVKAAELQQQARFEVWASSVKLTNDQNLERYRAQTQAMGGYYNAVYGQAQVFAGGLVQLQQQYTAVKLTQKQQTQSSDMGLVNISKFLGRVGNIIEPGAGDQALAYSDNLSRQLSDDLDQAARSGITVRVDGWNTNLPSPPEVQAALQALEPKPLPPFPDIWEDAPRQDLPKPDRR